jgi:hypothetical protein
MTRKLFAAAALAAGLAAAAAAAPPAWVGTYTYEQPLGPNLSGTIQNFITHRLVLTDVRCSLTAQGLQTDESIRCSVHPVANGLQIRFVSAADGSLLNRFGRQDHQKGQPLFTLTRRGGRLVTSWQGYALKPDKATPGSYFVKG